MLGWLVLRGRCADCAAPISPRYPLVELATAAAFLAVTWRLADLDRLAGLPAWLYFTAIAIALAAIDLDCHRLPNAIVLPSYPVLAVLLAGGRAVAAGLPAADPGRRRRRGAVRRLLRAGAGLPEAEWASATSSWPAWSAPCWAG